MRSEVTHRHDDEYSDFKVRYAVVGYSLQMIYDGLCPGVRIVAVVDLQPILHYHQSETDWYCEQMLAAGNRGVGRGSSGFH